MATTSAGYDRNVPSNARRPFEIGDLVEILPPYRDPADDTLTWRVVGAEEKGRVDISPVDSGMQIAPRYVVDTDWIRHSPTESDRDVV
jgi:hypothetical protein